MAGCSKRRTWDRVIAEAFQSIVRSQISLRGSGVTEASHGYLALALSRRYLISAAGRDLRFAEAGLLELLS